MKRTLLQSVALASLCLIAVSGLTAQKKVAYVYNVNASNGTATYIDSNGGTHPDLDPKADFVANGFEVMEITNPDISTMTEDEKAILASANCIYIGRGIASGTLFNQKALWNEVKTPIITQHMWALRGDRLGWFESTTGAGHVANEGGILEVEIPQDVQADPVFAGINVAEGVSWWNGNYAHPFQSVPGNGKIMAADGNGNIMFIRFEAGKAFYEGGATPAGERVYLGNATDWENATKFNYWSFTDEGKKVFFNELSRLCASYTPTSVKNRSVNLNALVYQTSAGVVVELDQLASVEVISVTGSTVASIVANGKSVLLPTNIKAGVYMVKASNTKGQVEVQKIIIK